MRQPQLDTHPHSEPTPEPGIARVLAEIQAGDGLSAAAAGKLFPGGRAGSSVNPATIWRWIIKGSKRPNGETVRLEAIRLGVKWVTSKAAVNRFITALSAPPAPAAATPPPRSPNRRRTAAAKADRELRELGV